MGVGWLLVAAPTALLAYVELPRAWAAVWRRVDAWADPEIGRHVEAALGESWDGGRS